MRPHEGPSSDPTRILTDPKIAFFIEFSLFFSWTRSWKEKSARNGNFKRDPKTIFWSPNYTLRQNHFGHPKRRARKQAEIFHAKNYLFLRRKNSDRQKKIPQTSPQVRPDKPSNRILLEPKTKHRRTKGLNISKLFSAIFLEKTRAFLHKCNERKHPKMICCRPKNVTGQTWRFGRRIFST